MKNPEMSSGSEEEQQFSNDVEANSKNHYSLREGGIVAKESKQPDLVKAMEVRGWNQSKTADFLGLTPGVFSDLLTGKKMPVEFSQEFEKKILDLTGKLTDDLFPRKQDIEPEFVSFDDPNDRSALKELDSKSAQEFFDGKLPAQDKEILSKELSEALLGVAGAITPREEEVIRLRFGLSEDGVEHGYEDVAEILKLSTRERVRQIEAKALRKLRHPVRSRFIKEFLE